MNKDRQGQVVRELEGQNQLLKKLYSTSIGRCALKILVSPFITHVGGFYMSSPLSKTSISSFIKNNSIDMRQYEEKKNSKLYQAAMEVITRANWKAMKEVKSSMCEALKELMAEGIVQYLEQEKVRSRNQKICLVQIDNRK